MLQLLRYYCGCCAVYADVDHVPMSMLLCKRSFRLPTQQDALNMSMASPGTQKLVVGSPGSSERHHSDSDRVTSSQSSPIACAAVVSVSSLVEVAVTY